LGFQIASPCSRRSYKYTVRHIEPRSPSGKDQMRRASGSMYPGTLDYVRHCAVLHRDAPRSPCSKRYLGVSSDLWSRFVLSGCVLEQGGYPSNEKEVWKKLSCHFLHPFPGRSLPFSLDSEAAAGHLPNDRCASAQLHASREGYYSMALVLSQQPPLLVTYEVPPRKLTGCPRATSRVGRAEAM
jgi:hypothetical protein